MKICAFLFSANDLYILDAFLTLPSPSTIFTATLPQGHSSDRLAAKFGVSRKDQDEYTVRSHTNAAAAHAAGLYKNEIIPVDGNVTENGIKGDSTYDKVAKLKPAFIKPHGELSLGVCVCA